MIREATKNDIQEIYNLGNLINSKFVKVYNEDSLFNDYTKILVYVSENEIMGFIHYEIMYEVVNLLNIVVKENVREKNIATFLMDGMMSNLCNKRVDKILLEVNSLNYKAINLYKKFNFEIINIRKKYYNGQDAYIMERSVK